MEEIWKDIPGYEGIYQVSNLGNVKSLDHRTLIHRNNETFWSTRRGKMLKQKVDRYGYLYVNVSGHNRKVHRLVMHAFVGPSDMTVNHKDENKFNNSLDNLEYMTVRDNLLYGTGMARRYKSARGRCKPVEQIDLSTGDVIKRYEGLVDTDKDGFSSQCVGKVCMRKRASHKGYGWRYADVERS